MNKKHEKNTAKKIEKKIFGGFVAAATFLFLFLFPSCVAEQKRNADLVVTYQGNVVHRGYSWYSSEKDFIKKLNDEEMPDFILFSSNWCRSCKLVKQKIEQFGWKDKIIVLNLDENWVNFIAGHLELRGIPALIIAKNKGKERDMVYYGPSTIVNKIYSHFGFIR